MKVLCILACVLGILSPTAAKSNCTLDLGLVVDTTKSLREKNIPILKEALNLLVQQFNISESETHVSLETFHKTGTVHNKFNDPSYYSVNAVMDLIDVSINKLKSPTRLDFALEKANDTMFTAESGDRPGERNVLVLFTDGHTSDKTDFDNYAKYIKNLKSKGVRLIVVAIGPDARKEESQQVLNETGGENVFYVADYESIAEAMKDITDLICPPSPCEDFPSDVAFVVDRTNSVGIENFKILKGFLLQLADAMSIGPDAAHVGYILFDKKPELLNTFGETEYHSAENVHSLITSIPNKLGSPTFIDRALKEANVSLFTPKGGDRPEAGNVLILMTDGRTNSESEPFEGIVDALKAKAVRRVALGIGKFEDFLDQLEEIAGDNVYTAHNFDELSDLFDEMVVETCSVDGGFSDWSDWSDCVQGEQERTRTCTNPPPHGYGEDCKGELKETRPC